VLGNQRVTRVEGGGNGFPVWALLLCWLGLQISLIVIAGNSIGGDAWAYAKSAQVFHETGRLMIPDRSPQSLIFLTLWSALFTKPFGFSFLTLNVAALTLNTIGLVFFLLLLREIPVHRPLLLQLYFYPLKYASHYVQNIQMRYCLHH
jgi:hypothetical protein